MYIYTYIKIIIKYLTVSGQLPLQLPQPLLNLEPRVEPDGGGARLSQRVDTDRERALGSQDARNLALVLGLGLRYRKGEGGVERHHTDRECALGRQHARNLALVLGLGLRSRYREGGGEENTTGGESAHLAANTREILPLCLGWACDTGRGRGG